MRTPNKQGGLSLVELMIAVALGLMILSGVLAIFANSNRIRGEIEKSSRQIENGRYAMQLLKNDLQAAGYLGEYVPPNAAPGVLPDICATDAASIEAGMRFHVQGNDNYLGGLACLQDVKDNTDVLVVRHAAACSSANPLEAGCDDIVAGAPYLQTSGCATDGISYKLSKDTGELTLRKVGCTNSANIRRFRTHIYFIANNNIGSDGVPTLKRAELGAGQFVIVPLVEGIENMQITYGIDNTNDGVPDDTYTTAPTTVADWWNTMAVKVDLLSRNESTSTGYTDQKTYTLGDNTFGPYNDGYRRHVYSAATKLENPAGRRE